MLEYTSLKHNGRKLVALTGLTPAEFEQLLPAFARAYRRRYPLHQTRTGQPRQRQQGGGRKARLQTIEQKLLFILVYQKAYPLQELLGSVFNLSQSRTNRWIHHLLPVLHRALANLRMLPQRNPRQFARRERRNDEPLDFIIDGTERRRQRPKDAGKQALHYSGKKKVHSDKNVVVVNTKSRRVGYLSQTYAGKTHDKKIADQEGIAYPRGAKLHKDTGFQGYEPAGCETYQPKKSHAAAN